MTTKLPRLSQYVPIIDENDFPSYPFHVWMQQYADSIESSLTSLIQALATMADLNDVHIPADSTGLVDPTQLPFTVFAKRNYGATDVSTTSTWSFVVNSGMLTATIANGALTVTALSTTSSVTINSVYLGITISKTFTIYVDIAPPPPSSGTSQTDASLNSISSTTHAPISHDLTITIGSTGIATLSAPNIKISTAAVAPGAVYPSFTSYDAYGKWQWYNGASWVDVNTEVINSTPCKVSNYNGAYLVTIGFLTVNTTKTGLAATSSQKFRFEARNSSGTRVMTFAGTVSASGS